MITFETNIVDSVRRILSNLKPLLGAISVVLIMRRRETAQMQEPYKSFSLAASLYDTREIDEIISAFGSFGIYVEHFEDELEFIAWHRQGGFDRLPGQYKFVYTFATSGTGPARRSLIPAYCAQEYIPTVNSDAYTCAVGRHKFHCSRLLGTFGLPVPQSWSYDANSGWLDSESPAIGMQVIGKATYEDGSIGLTSAMIGLFGSKLEATFAEASRALRQPLTVQEFIEGDEIEIPVIELDGHHALAPVMVLNSKGERLMNQVVSYDLAWSDDYRFAAPLCLSPHTIKVAIKAATNVARVLGHHGFARIDFRVSRDGRPIIIDIAAHPHLTRASSYAHSLNQMGFSYDEMMLLLIATGARRLGII